LNLSNYEIVDYLKSLDKEARAIREEALRFCWYMRGGLSYADALLLSQDERKIVSKIIEDNMETTKKSGLPFF
jgi:hypothetical protein